MMESEKVDPSNGHEGQEASAEVKSENSGHGGRRGKDGIKIFIGNLPPSATPDLIQEQFEGFGNLKGRYMRKYFGFVFMDTLENAKRAIESLNGKEVLGQKMIVEMATGVKNVKKGASPTDNCYRCGTAGHFSRDCSEPLPLTDDCFRCGESGHWSKDCPKSPSSSRKRKSDHQGGRHRKRNRTMFKLDRDPKTPVAFLPNLLGRENVEFTYLGPVATLSKQLFIFEVEVLDETFSGVGISMEDAKNQAAYAAITHFVAKKDNEVWEKMVAKVNNAPEEDGIKKEISEEVVLKLVSKPDNSFIERLKESKIEPKDPVRLLTEVSPCPPEYVLKCMEGPEHSPTFTMEVYIDGIPFKGKGRTKKDAKAEAAANALKLQIADHSSDVYKKLARMVTCTFVGEIPPIDDSELIKVIRVPVLKEIPVAKEEPVDSVQSNEDAEILTKILGADNKSPLAVLNMLSVGSSTFKFLEETGPAHSRLFHVEVDFRGKVYSGSANSKKGAKADAAKKALIGAYKCGDIKFGVLLKGSKVGMPPPLSTTGASRPPMSVVSSQPPNPATAPPPPLPRPTVPPPNAQANDNASFAEDYGSNEQMWDNQTQGYTQTYGQPFSQTLPQTYGQGYNQGAYQTQFGGGGYGTQGTQPPAWQQYKRNPTW